MTEMKLKEAIAGLKELKLCIIGRGKRIWIDREVCEVIDTAVEHCEHKTYTAEETQDFAEWVHNAGWKAFDDDAKTWVNENDPYYTITTVQLREMWEKERREK